MATHKFEKKMLATGVRANFVSLVSATTCAASLMSLLKGLTRSFFNYIICVWYIKQPSWAKLAKLSPRLLASKFYKTCKITTTNLMNFM
jgi:hypothetical protein